MDSVRAPRPSLYSPLMWVDISSFRVCYLRFCEYWIYANLPNWKLRKKYVLERFIKNLKSKKSRYLLSFSKFMSSSYSTRIPLSSLKLGLIRRCKIPLGANLVTAEPRLSGLSAGFYIYKMIKNMKTNTSRYSTSNLLFVFVFVN